MLEPEITKVYESFPAYELIKNYVVQQVISLGVMTSQVNAMLFLGRKDRLAEAQYKAAVLTFYQFLRPKMLDYSKFDPITALNIVKMDFFIMQTRAFTVRNAVMCFNFVNQFCEDYKLTSTTHATGYAKRKDDIYNV
jgi:hypothetical protein